MNDKRRNKLPLSIANMLADDIFNLSDEELLKEAQDEIDDVASEISNTKSAINSAVLKSNKSRLSAAKEQLEQKKKAANQNNILTLTHNDKRALIH